MKRITLCLSVLCVPFALDATASDATFDTYAEGVIAVTFTEGGITFFNLDCNLGSPSYSFLAEDATNDLTGMPGYSAPNCLGFTGYSPGPGTAFGRVLSFDMTTGQVESEAHLDLWDGGSYPGNTITLDALLNNVVVASDMQTVPAGGFIHAHHFAITGVSFDTLRVHGGGPQDNGVFFGLVDSVHVGSAPPGLVFCAGDGSGTACPCGNSSAAGAGQGCASSLGFGATLRATGTASITGDTLSLNAAQMPNAPCLFFQGTAQTSAGAGAVFGDGKRCAGGSIVRLGTKTNVGGASQYPAAGDPPVSVRGQVTTPGVREYQTWYRNAAAFCTPSTFNLTNGLEITWAP